MVEIFFAPAARPCPRLVRRRAQAAMRLGSLAKAAFFVFLVRIIRILAAPAAACRSARTRFGSSQNPGCGAVCSDAVVLRSLETSLTRRQTMQKGTVKWFNPTKGYGFIRPSSGDKDVFVHISAVERAGLSTLNEGQTVESELVTNRGKTSAENLKVSRRGGEGGEQATERSRRSRPHCP